MPSSRSEIPPFYVMEVMRAAAEREADGHTVLHLEVGQPSTPAPAGVLAAAHEALELNETSGLVISRDHITRALETSRPSVSERDARRLEAVYAKFRQGGGVDEAELRQGQKVSFA